ncbi:MAG TPA: hypothetical protein VK653_00040 [Xanthobacteraceae bacterium]|nr:hypothetical protein [Xanthobacteraceae bacterium]
MPEVTRGFDYQPETLSKRRRGRFSITSLVFATLAGAVVLVGSFLLTSYVLDYIDLWKQQQRAAATVEVSPISWQTAGAASYELQNGSVVFNGPDNIYVELPCGSLVSKIRFSVFVEHAYSANLQLQFISKEIGAIGQPLIQDISGITQKTVEIRSNTRQGAGLIRALIYSPENRSEAVIFKDPFIECKPVG